MQRWNCNARSASSAAGDGIALAVLLVVLLVVLLGLAWVSAALATFGPSVLLHPANRMPAARTAMCLFMAYRVGCWP